MNEHDGPFTPDQSPFTLRFSADTVQTALLMVAVDIAERVAAEGGLPVERDGDDIPTDHAVQAVLGDRHLICPASLLLDLALALGIQPPPLIRGALH